MPTIHGDLITLALDGKFDVIVHGCNCHCVMGAGIAKTIKTVFPEAFAAECATRKGDKLKLGTLTYATVSRAGRNVTIVNGYTQYHWHGSGILVDYDAVRQVLSSVKALLSGTRIGYPKIGVVLARGDWEQIRVIIETELAGENHTLVEYAE